ncbi:MULTISPECIES: hypothetical protein [Paenibacillus]|uniref:hypothetical protein n=1 Tax=Paenibacillus TaxID=44249 RepID=UPI002281FB33|nr:MULTISPECIES: hypothetical protein [Paenibacillus]MCY7485376.1 hypothetical protein [Paenibacillus alvei]
MERRPYYVSVQNRSVVAEQDAGDYEFVVHVNEAERDELQRLLNGVGDAETDQVYSFMLFTSKSNDMINEPYQQNLNSVYAYIHKFGTTETKQFVEQIREVRSEDNDGI